MIGFFKNCGKIYFMKERLSESVLPKKSLADVRREIAELLDSGHAVSSFHIAQLLMSGGLSLKSKPDIMVPRFEELTGVSWVKTK